METEDRILNEQRFKDLQSTKLWVGETYIHFETRVPVELGSVGGDFVVLKNKEGDTLPDNFKLIWDTQDFINEFVSEFSMNRTHDLFP
jgi:hypothetical protein